MKPKSKPELLCPQCGGSMKDGYGEVSTKVRGFMPASETPIGIYGKPDRTRKMCRICFAFYAQVIDTLNELYFHGLVSGIEAGW